MTSIGLMAQLACVWEATARKPGNVHRFADFDDVAYLDFILSAAAVAPILNNAPQRRVGETVLHAVQARRRLVASNTNLGILLLLAPLAAVPLDQDLETHLPRVLDELDVADSRSVYEAIRLAGPGGMGKAREQDLSQEPTLPLRRIMALAADRDLIALQYTNGFKEVLGVGLAALECGRAETRSLEGAILYCHLLLMAHYPDSLIARKRGVGEAREASQHAQRVLEAGWPRDPTGAAALTEFDAWLRAEGHSRNPGTTADLVTACLFVALRKGIITVPPQVPWSCG